MIAFLSVFLSASLLLIRWCAKSIEPTNVIIIWIAHKQNILRRKIHRINFQLQTHYVLNSAKKEQPESQTSVCPTQMVFNKIYTHLFAHETTLCSYSQSVRWAGSHNFYFSLRGKNPWISKYRRKIIKQYTNVGRQYEKMQ